MPTSTRSARRRRRCRPRLAALRPVTVERCADRAAIGHDRRAALAPSTVRRSSVDLLGDGAALQRSTQDGAPGALRLYLRGGAPRQLLRPTSPAPRWTCSSGAGAPGVRRCTRRAAAATSTRHCRGRRSMAAAELADVVVRRRAAPGSRPARPGWRDRSSTVDLLLASAAGRRDAGAPAGARGDAGRLCRSGLLIMSSRLASRASRSRRAGRWVWVLSARRRYPAARLHQRHTGHLVTARSWPRAATRASEALSY